MIDDYLDDVRIAQGARCPECLDEVTVDPDAYLDHVEGDREPRLLCKACADRSEIAYVTDDPVAPTRRVHWTRRADVWRTWRGIVDWEAPNPSDRNRIIVHARALARRRLTEACLEGTLAGASMRELLAAGEGISADRLDRETARVLRELAEELDGSAGRGRGWR